MTIQGERVWLRWAQHGWTNHLSKELDKRLNSLMEERKEEAKFIYLANFQSKIYFYC